MMGTLENTVRRATEADLAAAERILGEARATMKRNGIVQWTSDYPTLRELRTDLENGCLYVVCREGAPIGAAQILCEGDPHYEQIDGRWRGKGAHIAVHRVTVSSSLGRSGAATELLAYAESCARACGAESLRMDTHPDNQPMKSLLEKNGFSLCGTVIEPATGKKHLAYEKLL